MARAINSFPVPVSPSNRTVESGDEFAGFAMAVFHGVDERQGDFAFFQIAEDGLAELFGGSGEIEEVVHHLKSEAGVAAVVGESFFFVAAESAENCSQARAATEKTGGFVGCKFERVFFAD